MRWPTISTRLLRLLSAGGAQQQPELVSIDANDDGQLFALTRQAVRRFVVDQELLQEPLRDDAEDAVEVLEDRVELRGEEAAGSILHEPRRGGGGVAHAARFPAFSASFSRRARRESALQSKAPAR